MDRDYEMHSVEPRVHILAETVMDRDGLKGYLDTIGASSWSSDASSDVEEIIEVQSRSCYKSFEPGLNPNVQRVRRHNESYLENIINVNHGSVLEHAWVSFMFTDVSRVFTHELVRHRVGVAISQESLRYVRLEDLGCWIPSCFSDIPRAVQVFEVHFRECEEAYTNLLQCAAMKEGVDSFDDLSFSKKKEYTSAARRVAPIGLATSIGWSCNIRALRHVITMRIDPSAEEEIRYVFNKVKDLAQDRWPVLFRDL